MYRLQNESFIVYSLQVESLNIAIKSISLVTIASCSSFILLLKLCQFSEVMMIIIKSLTIRYSRTNYQHKLAAVRLKKVPRSDLD